MKLKHGILAILATICSQIAGVAVGASSPNLNVVLNITGPGQGGGAAVIAHLKFSNPGSTAVFLDRLASGDTGPMLNPLFTISSASGRKVPYRGVLGQRKAVQTTDFVKIDANGTYETEVNLSDSYTFPKGSSTFKVDYLAFNAGYPDRTLGQNLIQLNASASASLNLR